MKILLRNFVDTLTSHWLRGSGVKIYNSMFPTMHFVPRCGSNCAALKRQLSNKQEKIAALEKVRNSFMVVLDLNKIKSTSISSTFHNI